MDREALICWERGSGESRSQQIDMNERSHTLSGRQSGRFERFCAVNYSYSLPPSQRISIRDVEFEREMRPAMAEQRSSRTVHSLLLGHFGFAATGLAVLILSGQARGGGWLYRRGSCACQRARDEIEPANRQSERQGGCHDTGSRQVWRRHCTAPMQDKSVIAPAPDKHDPMPTVPDVNTQKQQDGSEAERSGLQAALIAARAQAERGDEKGCREALARARILAEQDKGGG